MVEFVNRKNSNCYKWDSQEALGNLPLWVADMDFKAAPAIIEALQKRVEHGVFGYNIVPDEYFCAVSNWFKRRHNWSGISRENIIPTIGVVPAISAVLKSQNMFLANKLSADSRQLKVLTFTPAYNCFFSSINNLDAELVESRLVNVNNRFEINWGDLEAKLPTVDVLLLCNPHNPTGRVWTKDELTRLRGMCQSSGTFVVADEIHCEITDSHHHYTPYATIAEGDADYCVLTSASKAFNIAGLQCANIYVPSQDWYERIDKAINIHEVCDLNPFGVVATIAAYNEGEEWLQEVNDLVRENYNYLKQYLQDNLPQFMLTEMEGTYLAWVKLPPKSPSAKEFCEQLSQRQKLLLNPSEMYGAEGYIRINLATSIHILKDALHRLSLFCKEIYQ